MVRVRLDDGRPPSVRLGDRSVTLPLQRLAAFGELATRSSIADALGTTAEF
jgi:hypothetical protein